MTAWQSAALGELGTITTGSTPTATSAVSFDGDLPFVTPAELGSSAPISQSARSLSNSGARGARVLPTDTVMVCCIGTLGKVGIAGVPVATNQQINSITFDTTRIVPRFGFYACQMLGPQLGRMSSATTLPIVSKSKFALLNIPVPPIEEQRRIADILDRADALRAKRREALTLLDDLTQSIFLDMFSGSAASYPSVQLQDAFWFQEGPGVRKWQFRDAGIKLLNVGNIKKSGHLDLTNTERHLDPGEVAIKYAHFLADEAI